MYENMLPIGSVVLLEGGQRRLMVVGRIHKMRDDDTIYDYIGCPYPEGVVGDSYAFFNRDDIERVYFIGFQDSESLEYSARLAALGELYVDEDGHIQERKAEDEA